MNETSRAADPVRDAVVGQCVAKRACRRGSVAARAGCDHVTPPRDATAVSAAPRDGSDGTEPARSIRRHAGECRPSRATLPVMTRQIMIEIDDDILAGLGLSAEEFSDEARWLLAAKLYELGRLSSGKAAKLCGRDRVQFLLELPRLGVGVSNLRADDAEAEIRFGQDG